MPTFDAKSEKFELFDDLFQTSFKIHKQLTEEDKISYFQSLMRGGALPKFQKHHQPQQRKFGRKSDCVP